MIPARYLGTLLDRVEAGGQTCTDLMMAVSTQLSAMTLSIRGMEGVLAAFAAGEDEEVAGDALATAVADADRDEGSADPKAQVRSRIAPRVRELCPDLAPVILR